jgi:hypothetical protein
MKKQMKVLLHLNKLGLYKNILLITMLYLSAINLGYSQTACTQKLKLAEKHFDEGVLFDISSNLESCLKGGFSKEEETQAYRLLALVHLYLDDYTGAENAIVMLLKHDPEYRVDPILDPAELVFLVNKFRTFPVYSVGLRIGSNRSSLRVLQHWGLQNTDVFQDTYFTSFSYVVGLNIEYFLNRNLQLVLDPSFNQSIINQERIFNEFYKINLTEDQLWFNLPFGIRYGRSFNRFTPFVYAGAAVNFLFSSEGEFTRTVRSTEINEKTVEGPRINLNEQRNHLHFAILSGAGVKYKVGINYLILDLKYMRGLNNLAKPEARYLNSETVFKYGYIDNDFSLDNIFISVGYSKSFYKPKRLKN